MTSSSSNPSPLVEKVASKGAGDEILARLRDSQGVPFHDRVEVDFDALVAALAHFSKPLPAPSSPVMEALKESDNG